MGVAIVLMVCAPGHGSAAARRAKSHHWVAYPVDAYQPNFEPRAGQATVDVPEVIRERFEQEVQDSYKGWRREAVHDPELLEFPLSDYYGPLVRLAAPHERWLFVFELRGPVGWSEFRLLLYEPGTQRVSPATLRLPNKWTSGFAVKHPKPDDLLQEPYLGFGDLDDDGEPDLVVERYGHNGTMYNAVLDYVFSIQDDLRHRGLVTISFSKRATRSSTDVELEESMMWTRGFVTVGLLCTAAAAQPRSPGRVPENCADEILVSLRKGSPMPPRPTSTGQRASRTSATSGTRSCSASCGNIHSRSATRGGFVC